MTPQQGVDGSMTAPNNLVQEIQGNQKTCHESASPLSYE